MAAAAEYDGRRAPCGEERSETDEPDELPPRRRRRVLRHRGAGWSVERRVLAEDRPLELTERRPGLQPEFLREHPPRLAIDVECCRLAAGPIEREDQLRAEALVERMLGR